MYACIMPTLFDCSSSQLFTYKAEYPHSLKSVGHTKKIIGHEFNIQGIVYVVFMTWSIKESNPELPRIIYIKGDRKQSNVIEMLAVLLAYDYAIHHGGSYDVQQHVISKKHQRSTRQSIRAGTDGSLQHRPVVQDTKQMHLWCVIRFSFAFTYCRSKHDIGDEKLLALFYHKDSLIRGYI